MPSLTTSPDGTQIAYDQWGSGDPIIVISGMLSDRQASAALAEELATDVRVITYDRRGRGESGNQPPYDVDREVEDLASLIHDIGGSSAVYGHSSGAALALRAAAADLPITRLVLHEPPYGHDDDASTSAARQLAQAVSAQLEAGRPAAAIDTFLSEAGAPSEMREAMSSDPSMVALAPTMVHDFAVVGDLHGGTIPEELAERITIPTLVLAGAESPEFFLATAERLSTLIPGARHRLLDGVDHGAPAHVVAPAIAEFLRR